MNQLHRTIALCLIACGCGGTVGPQAITTRPPPESHLGPQAITTGPPVDGSGFTRLADRTYVLTFDDGPTDATLPIARLLHEEGIRATFFVEGTHGLGYGAVDKEDVTGFCSDVPGRHSHEPVCDPASSGYILRQLIALGHSIGNHTSDHVNLALLLADEGRAVTLQQITSMHPYLAPFMRDWLFRAPYGAIAVKGETIPYSVPSAMATDPIARGYYGPFHWINEHGALDYECNDPSLHSPTLNPSECAQTLTEFLGSPAAKTSGIILRHDWLEFIDRADTSSLDDDPGIPSTPQTSMYSFKLAIAELDQLHRRFNPIAFVPIDATPESGIPQRFSNFGERLHAGFSEGRYSKIEFGDLDATNGADVCGRESNGIFCALSSGNSFSPPEPWLTTEFTDKQGWEPPEFNDTIQLADVTGDGRADICGRGHGGIYCAAAASDGSHRFVNAHYWSFDFSNAGGWNLPQYYKTVRLADIDGDGRADACGRGAAGIYCARSTGIGFDAATLVLVDPVEPLSSPFSNAKGWDQPQYFESIQFADVTGDGRADVCGRASTGMWCAQGTAQGDFDYTSYARWSAGNRWPNMSDSTGVGNSPSTYSTVQLGDIDGDGKADVCYRAAFGLMCGQSTGSRFAALKIWEKDHLVDRAGWGISRYATTLRLADVTNDHRADICGRFVSGTIVCGNGISEPTP